MAYGIEETTPVDSIKDVVRSSVKVPEFDKHPKKAGGHIGWNVVEVTIEIRTIVRKYLMMKNMLELYKSFDSFQNQSHTQRRLKKMQGMLFFC